MQHTPAPQRTHTSMHTQKTCTDFKGCRNYSLHTNWGLAHSAWLSIWNKYTCKCKTGKMQNQWNTCFLHSPKAISFLLFSYLRQIFFLFFFKYSGAEYWHVYPKMPKLARVCTHCITHIIGQCQSWMLETSQQPVRAQDVNSFMFTCSQPLFLSHCYKSLLSHFRS